METKRIPSNLIDPPTNRHRVEITEESIIDLAKDIRDQGLINAISVREVGQRFEVIAGERRYTAMNFLGWPLMECKNYGVLTDEACEKIRLKENIEREQLSPFEEALQIYSLYRQHQSNIVLTAKACHRSKDWVQSRVDLNSIQDELQPMVHRGELKIGAALALAQIQDDSDRAYFTRLVKFDGCTIAVLQRWVDDYLTQKMRQPDIPPTMPEIPAPGQAIKVYLDCNMCDTPTDTRERQIKFICAHCQAIWDDYREAYKSASVLAAAETNAALALS